jgi:hypothetical protein
LWGVSGRSKHRLTRQKKKGQGGYKRQSGSTDGAHSFTPGTGAGWESSVCEGRCQGPDGSTHAQNLQKVPLNWVFEKPRDRITWYSTKMVMLKEELWRTFILRMEVPLNSASQQNHFIECYFFKELSYRIDRLGLVDTLTYLHHVPVIQHCCRPITIL